MGYTFHIESNLVVVGRNPELADMSNPNGDVIAERFFMVATDAEGYQFAYGRAKSEREMEVVFQHFSPPVQEWPYYRTVYGSEAYQAYGSAEELHDEVVGELGADWRNHPDARAEGFRNIGLIVENHIKTPEPVAR